MTYENPDPVAVVARFPIGCVVQLSAFGRMVCPPKASRGRVVGYGRTRTHLRVKRDGRRHAISTHPDHWEPVAPTTRIDTDKAAERLVFALHIYPGYRVDSRGPTGCIMDALDAIAPEVAAEVREGSACAVHDRRWGDG